MKTSFFRFSLVLVVLAFGLVASARSEDLGAVKTRISERLPKLDTLKKQGVIGETNHGTVELRSGGPESGDVVAAENHDREAVYAAIAQQTGSSVETVAKARAKQIAAGSAAGVWLQKDDGTWYKK